MVEDKIRMCDVLSDIEVAQDLLETKEEEEEEQKELQPHPADEKYTTLQADLKIIRPEEEEYQVAEKFAEVPACPITVHLQPGTMSGQYGRILQEHGLNEADLFPLGGVRHGKIALQKQPLLQCLIMCMQFC